MVPAAARRVGWRCPMAVLIRTPKPILVSTGLYARKPDADARASAICCGVLPTAVDDVWRGVTLKSTCHLLTGRRVAEKSWNLRYWRPTRPEANPVSRTLHVAQAQSNRDAGGRKRHFRDAERSGQALGRAELTLVVPDAEQRLWRTVMRRKYEITRSRVQLHNRLDAVATGKRIRRRWRHSAMSGPPPCNGATRSGRAQVSSGVSAAGEADAR